MSSSYQSPGGPGCPPECFIDRYAPTMWVEANRARKAHEAHAAQPAAEPPACDSSGVYRFYTPHKVTASDATGKPTYARVSCVTCGREFVTRIVRSREGNPLNGDEGMVVVPRHRAAPEG